MSDIRKWIKLVEGLDDESHAEALARTNFWGSRGSGTVPFAKSTGRFLINHRSRSVEQPGTWGVWGGAIDSQEDPQEAAERELREEAGYDGLVTMVPLYVFKKGTFRYHNFLGIVDEEFTPHLDWESQGYEWVDFGKWPVPTHFGLLALINDPESAKIMQAMVAKAKGKDQAKPSTKRPTKPKTK